MLLDLRSCNGALVASLAAAQVFGADVGVIRTTVVPGVTPPAVVTTSAPPLAVFATDAPSRSAGVAQLGVVYRADPLLRVVDPFPPIVASGVTPNRPPTFTGDDGRVLLLSSVTAVPYSGVVTEFEPQEAGLIVSAALAAPPEVERVYLTRIVPGVVPPARSFLSVAPDTYAVATPSQSVVARGVAASTVVLSSTLLRLESPQQATVQPGVVPPPPPSAGKVLYSLAPLLVAPTLPTQPTPGVPSIGTTTYSLALLGVTPVTSSYGINGVIPSVFTGGLGARVLESFATSESSILPTTSGSSADAMGGTGSVSASAAVGAQTTTQSDAVEASKPASTTARSVPGSSSRKG